jgi:hypothetical protein
MPGTADGANRANSVRILRHYPLTRLRCRKIIGGIVLHPLFAPTTPKGKPGPELRRVADIIEAIISRDGRPMDQPREPENRVLGTCRTHALLACAVLRQHKCPARLRVGFADYFTPGFAEDHWICEYRDGHIWRRWTPS